MIYGCSQPRELWFIDFTIRNYTLAGFCLKFDVKAVPFAFCWTNDLTAKDESQFLVGHLVKLSLGFQNSKQE